MGGVGWRAGDLDSGGERMLSWILMCAKLIIRGGVNVLVR